MTLLKAIWHFIGSITFAILLIASTALFVIVGTWIESSTGSHLHASYYTYGSPLFAALLCGFFVNILVSALRRWPFQQRHIPFLLTHLGLLLLISGVLIKIYWGTQGSLSVIEGGASSEIFLMPTLALSVESPGKKTVIPLKENSHQIATFDKVRFKTLQWIPHSQQRWLDWIKDDLLTLRNVPPILADSRPIPLLQQPPWHIAYTKNSPLEYLRTHTQIIIRNPLTQNTILDVPLIDFLANGFDHAPYLIHGKLTDNAITLRFENTLTDQTEIEEFSLDSKTPLFNRSEHILPRQFSVELQASPTFVFHDDSLTILQSHGTMQTVPLKENTSLYSYDKGYGGYSLTKEIATNAASNNRQALWNEVAELLSKSSNEGTPLAPPLQLLQQQTTEFAVTFTQFLEEWFQEGCWLCSASKIMPELDWTTVPQEYKRWKAKAILFTLLQNASYNGDNTLERLKTLLHIEGNATEILQALDAHAEMLAEALPQHQPSDSLIFSAALREHGITPDIFLHEIGEDRSEVVQLETKLKYHVEAEEPLAKWEDNRPAVLMEAVADGKKEHFWLALDKFASQLKVPILQGQYLVRLQALTEKIPYRIRLREARQINYPGTSQPFSYEADIWVNDELATLSMNQVYETWDGYRFYLSNIAPGKRDALQQVHIVVNRDPAKYYATLPGFALLTVGALWLLLRSGRGQYKRPM